MQEIGVVVSVLGTATLMLIPLFITAKAVRALSWTTLALLFGASFTLVFAICIGVPYYFQGHNDLQSVPAETPSGLLSFSPIALVAYFLSFASQGFTWLSISSLLLAFGSLQTRPMAGVAIRVVGILLNSVFLLDMRSFSKSIGMILE
jgi:hypothetical protein